MKLAPTIFLSAWKVDDMLEKELVDFLLSPECVAMLDVTCCGQSIKIPKSKHVIPAIVANGVGTERDFVQALAAVKQVPELGVASAQRVRVVEGVGSAKAPRPQAILWHEQLVFPEIIGFRAGSQDTRKYADLFLVSERPRRTRRESRSRTSFDVSNRLMPTSVFRPRQTAAS